MDDYISDAYKYKMVSGCSFFCFFLCYHCLVCEAGWVLGVRESGFESGQRAH